MLIRVKFGIVDKVKELKEEMESFLWNYLWEFGVTILSLLEKYIPFSGFCTIPWRMRSPIRVFISVGFVSIQLLARDRGFKLGFAAKNLLAHICLFNKQLPHIFISKLLKTFHNINFIIKVHIHSTYTEKCKSWDAPRREVQKVAKNLTLHMVHFHAQYYLYPNLSLNLPHLYQTKNHQIPTRIHHFRLQCLKLWRYPRLLADLSCASYLTLSFLSF